MEGAPVNWLECMSRTLESPSADHEGGSGPADGQAAFMTGMLACKAESFRQVGTEKRLAGLQDAPVRLLECKERKVNVLTVDHEGGSCPAHHLATLEPKSSQQS